MTVYINTHDLLVSEQDGFVEFIVRLSEPSAGEVRVSYITGNGSATYNSSGDPTNDFASLSGTLVFAPGVMQQTVRVPINNDKAVEKAESLYLLLTSTSNGVIVRGHSTANIIDNDTPADVNHKANLSVRDLIVDASAGTATFAVVLDKATSNSFSVAWHTADASARAGTDYVAATGSLTFKPGETVKTVSISLQQSGLAVPAETFALVLDGIAGNAADSVTLADNIGQALIGPHGQVPVDKPHVSVSNAIASEIDGYIDFVVSLDAPAKTEVRATYITNDYSATSGYRGDYAGLSGVLVFAPGVTTQTIRVAVNDDALVEDPQSFTLKLSGAATFANPLGIGTIIDNDTVADAGRRAHLLVDDVIVDATADTATFSVTLDKATGDSFSVAYTTANASALAGRDYTETAGTLVFGPGETVKTVTVPLRHDGTIQPAKLFDFLLGAVSGNAAANVTVANGISHALIGAHGGLPVTNPVLSVNNPIVSEADGYAEFTFTLSSPSSRDVIFNVITNDGSATGTYGGTDYGSLSEHIVIPAGVTTQTTRVFIGNDAAAESTESFGLQLQSVSNAILDHANGIATIIDNDILVDATHKAVASVRDVVVDATAGVASFAVILDKAPTSHIGIAYKTVDGSAHAGSDYTAVGGTLNFGPGETAKTVTVPLLHDGAAEPVETFALVLDALSGSGAGSVVIGDAAGEAAIPAHGSIPVAAPSLLVADTTVDEKLGYVDFVVSLSAPSLSEVWVSYQTSNGTATAGTGGDFVGTSGQLKFAPGVTSQVVRVIVTADNVVEPMETFSFSLTSTFNGKIATPKATAFIVDTSAPYQAATFIKSNDATPSSHDLVSQIYLNVLHRPAEAAGLDYWVNVLDTHAATAAEVHAFISESAENQSEIAEAIGNGFTHTPYG